MEAKTKKWIYRISFVIVVLIFYFFQWNDIGFIESLKWDAMEYTAVSRVGNMFLGMLEITMNIGNYLLQIGLPVFLGYKGFIQKPKHK